MLENITVKSAGNIFMKDIPDDTYFGPQFHGFVSNSRLSLLNPLQGGTPDKFFSGTDNSYTDSFFLGTAVHEIILQPESFEIAEGVNRPTAKLGFMADELYGKETPTLGDVRKASKKFQYYVSTIDKRYDSIINGCSPYWSSRKEFEKKNANGKQFVYLDQKRRKQVKDIVSAFNDNNDFKKAMEGSFIVRKPKKMFETAFVTAFIVDTGKNKYVIPFKGKLDEVIFDYDMQKVIVNDVKTTGMDMEYFNDNIIRFHYQREMAVYLYLAMHYAKEKFGWPRPEGSSSLLTVESMNDHLTQIFDIKKDLLKKGWFEFVQLLKLIGYYMDNGYKL